MDQSIVPHGKNSPSTTTTTVAPNFYAKYSKVLAVLPYLFVLLSSYYLVHWDKHPVSTFLRDYFTQKAIQRSLDSYCYLADPKRDILYLQYEVAPGLKEKYGDTLTIRFAHKILKNIAYLDYNNQKYSLNLGFVFLRHPKSWELLYPRSSPKDDFVFPFCIKNGNTSSAALAEQLYLEILPLRYREDSDGNKTRIIKTKNK